MRRAALGASGCHYLRPADLGEALAAIADRPRLVIAGGTDVYPARVGRPLSEPVLDITAIEQLRGISDTVGGWRIGALVTWAELSRTPLPPLFDALKAAAREIGGQQIQNAATLAGNLCNASPAADGAPCLLAMDAVVELASVSERRLLPLGDFLLGNRRTALRPDELLTAILVPRPAGSARSAFRKLGARRYLVISIVMLAMVLELNEASRITRAGIAVGACAPTARRLASLEHRLAGQSLTSDLGALVTPGDLDVLAPIDDIRATAAYRRDALLTLLRRELVSIDMAAG